MNSLAIDYGLKRIGLAYSQNDIIFTLPQIQNDQHLVNNLKKIINDYQIGKIYIGLSEGRVAEITKKFIVLLSSSISLPIETIEESVSTLEAEKIYIDLKKSKKNYKQKIDSFSAAVILKRAIGYN
jgi:putative transcription antitermination factor YqgF